MALVPQVNYNPNVYEPSDDTFLFLDALMEEKSFIQSLKPQICVEIGCGSGVVLTSLAQSVLGTSYPAMCFAIDINMDAAKMARETAHLNKVQFMESVRSNLLDCFSTRLRNSIDVLLFNPPYVPTPSSELGSKDIQAAWAGGKYGREVIDKVLPLIKNFLTSRGVFYMVVVKENKPLEIANIMKEYGFSTKNVLSRTAQNEKLSILKFTRLKQ